MFEIGVISCVHGYEGEVVLRISTEVKKLPKFVFIEIDGTYIPFKIEKITNKGQNFIIHFEDINDRSDASEIIKKKVFLNESNIEEYVDVVEENIIGFKIIDKNFGEIGVVKEIQQYPAHDCILGEKNNKTFLIPFVDEIVLEIDKNHQSVFTEVPQGLF